MTLQGSGDFATITYDEETLAVLRQNFGSYVLSRSYRLPMYEEH
jgi:hypothetical protein